MQNDILQWKTCILKNREVNKERNSKLEKRGKYKILENIKIAKDVFKMIIQGDTSCITKPGQFINIEIEGLYLRRPISICEYDDKTITIIYKVVGKGTEKMSLIHTKKLENIIENQKERFYLVRIY